MDRHGFSSPTPSADPAASGELSAMAFLVGVVRSAAHPRSCRPHLQDWRKHRASSRAARDSPRSQANDLGAYRARPDHPVCAGRHRLRSPSGARDRRNRLCIGRSDAAAESAHCRSDARGAHATTDVRASLALLRSARARSLAISEAIACRRGRSPPPDVSSDLARLLHVRIA